MSQTYSTLSNLSLNNHGHVEVPKSKKKIEKKSSALPFCILPLNLVEQGNFEVIEKASK